jgi:uncharacterized protein YciI
MVFFLCITEPNEGLSPEDLYPHLPEHKKWVAELERQGTIFVAGPLLSDEQRASGSGALVVRSHSYTEARQTLDSDPFHAKGMRTYRLWPWQINEGSFRLRVRLSDGAFDMR